eukprot:472718_1
MSNDSDVHSFAVFKGIEWISVSVISLIAVIIIAKMLHHEKQKRKSTDILFVNKWIKLWSSLSIALFCVWNIINAIEYFPLLCHFAHALDLAVLNIASGIVGFYQLSRLHYCFSQNSTYTKKGYSTFTFIIMYSFGILITICNAVTGVLNTVDISGKCGIDSRIEYYSTVWTNNPISIIWIYIGWSAFLVWDLITLALYTIKVLQLRKYNQSIQIIRVMSILKRVIILTIFYELGILIVIVSGILHHYYVTEHNTYYNEIGATVVRIIYEWSWVFMTVMMSYSILIMQQHNTDKYIYFLHILHRCCCRQCKSIIGNVNEFE